MTARELLAGITDIAPTFANATHQVILEGAPPTSDLPAYGAPAEDTPLHEWGQRNDPTKPLHVAFAWWTALMHRDSYRDVLHDLTHSPSAFGDYEWAADLLGHRSIASKVYYSVDDPERVAFVRFVPEVAQASQSFATFTMAGAVYMPLCRHPDGTWRVWGLGEDMVSARSVLVAR